jgi:5-methylcytosine-specific restriction endonuclease McrA
MSLHRNDKDIKEVKNYFEAVIEWVSSMFVDVKPEMKGLEWGRLYETYQSQPLNHDEVNRTIHELYSDGFVENRKGIWEYVLGDSKDTKLLSVRIFLEPTKKATYAKQTSQAKALGSSNCPLCAEGHEANRAKVWKFEEMDADHVSPWSKGGASTPENCQMLCKTHNRSKGNR